MHTYGKERRLSDMFLASRIVIRVLDRVACAHQERTEEDEGDKVEVGNLAATLRLWIS